MFSDTGPAALDAHGGSDPWAEFRVAHPQERLGLLRQLRDGSVAVNLAAPDGSMLTTTLWSIDDGSLSFQADAASPQLARLLDADEAVAVAYLESVKLQFDLHDLVLVRGPQAAALRAALPAEVYRFQRRQAYRVRTLERHAPSARLRHPALPEMRLALRVLDVSLGGCALWQPGDVPPMPAGTVVGEAEITLDADTRFNARLTLHHVSTLGGGVGHHAGARIGCEWKLDGAAERQLHRWIDQAQKRRRLHSLA
jgi:flagellar brake protein